MNIVTIKSTAAIATIAIVVASMGIASIPVQAGTVSNDSIHINKSRLKGKCKRSGGTYSEGSNGRFGCSVDRDDGGFTTVNCNKKNNCVGFTNDGKKRVGTSARRTSSRSTGRVVRR